MGQIRVNINGTEINTFEGQTILEVAQTHGIDIPTLCHHPSLKNFGSCGMCVVEVVGTPKLIRSCSSQIQDGMVIRTQTNRVKESRRTTLELMMSDHVGDCKAPCTLNCPSNVDIQGYVGLTANGEFGEALKLIKEDLPLPASIGRVCPHPCQTACRRDIPDDSIAIAWIKRFVADVDLQTESPYLPECAPDTGKRVAVIGGGPGGLAAAYFLRRSGHTVAVYEAMPEFGGMLQYGIPLYRLPKDVLNLEIELIEKLGVKLIPNIRIGEDLSFDHIRENFDAVYVSIGAWNSAFMDVPGKDADGIIGGIEFLNKFALNQAIRTGNRIAVIGGGNTAMDAARTAIRLGAKEVYAIYRRTKAEMPAVDIEIEEAEEEGVEFKFLLNPVEFIKDETGRVCRIRLQKMEQGPMDATGRRSVIPTDEEEILEVDSVIMSIGQKLKGEGLEAIALNSRGNIQIDERRFTTNLEGVFAGGDAVNRGAGIAIQAIADGKHAARAITEYLRGAEYIHMPPVRVEREGMTIESYPDVVITPRVAMGHEPPQLRQHNFEEVVKGFTPEEAQREGNRCLECGCMDVHECQLFEYGNRYKAQPIRLKGEINQSAGDTAHPYFERDSDKCILCGMCVRVCDEVMGLGILGFAQRGFEAVIQPAFDKPFTETACISCGQCTSICPTGALQEKAMIHKPVPLLTEKTDSVCNRCGLGCNLTLESSGSMLLKSVPRTIHSVNEGVLCEKGRFELVKDQNQERLTKPMIRKDGHLSEVTWDEAMLFTAKKAQSLFLRYGENTLATVVTGTYTNEELYLLQKLCVESFKTTHLYSSCGYDKGLNDVLGYDASTNAVSELDRTDLIVSIGARLMEKQPVLGVRIRKATQNGARLIVINDHESQQDEWATAVHRVENDLGLLKEVAVALLAKRSFPANALGELAFRESLDGVTAGEAAQQIAAQLLDAKNAMFVFERERLTDEAVMLTAEIALLSGHIGRPRNGLIQLRAQGNSQGLVDLGFKMDTASLTREIQDEKVRGLMVMGESVNVTIPDNIEFLLVQENQLSEIGMRADVVLPRPTHVETAGTMTRQDRKIQQVRRAVQPHVEMTVLEQLEKIMRVFGNRHQSIRLEDLMEEIGKTVPTYLHANELPDQDVCWPVGRSRILYEEAFATPDGKARFQACSGKTLFRIPAPVPACLTVDEEVAK